MVLSCYQPIMHSPGFMRTMYIVLIKSTILKLISELCPHYNSYTDCRFLKNCMIPITLSSGTNWLNLDPFNCNLATVMLLALQRELLKSFCGILDPMQMLYFHICNAFSKKLAAWHDLNTNAFLFFFLSWDRVVSPKFLAYLGHEQANLSSTSLFFKFIRVKKSCLLA